MQRQNIQIKRFLHIVSFHTKHKKKNTVHVSFLLHRMPLHFKSAFNFALWYGLPYTFYISQEIKNAYSVDDDDDIQIEYDKNELIVRIAHHLAVLLFYFPCSIVFSVRFFPSSFIIIIISPVHSII